MASPDSREASLTYKQRALLLALTEGCTVEQAAKIAHCSERSAYRWVKLPAFQEALAQAQQEAFRKRIQQLRAGVGLALSTLEKHMYSPETPAALQIRAAQIWLDTAFGASALLAVEERLRELEALVKEQVVMEVPTHHGRVRTIR